MLIRTLPVTTHGRYLLDVPAGDSPWPLLVGFHGYAENADISLGEMRRLAGDGRWLVAAVQGLHAFYSRGSERVVASWMTRQDRELAIADNIRYVGAAIGAIAGEYPLRPSLVYAGFSQGAAMAYRAAAAAGHPAAGVIVLGGDVPPDLADHDLSRFPPVLIGRGTGDTWYTKEKLDSDLAWLGARGIRAQPFVFEGGHEWTESFRE